MAIERVKTEIKGFDELIEGGFPKGRTILVTGGCGTGKTLFAMEYLYNGAIKFKEPGIYVTMDERPSLIREDCLKLGWELKKLEDTNLLTIIDGSMARIGMPSEEEFSLPSTGFDADKLLLEIMRIIKRTGATRIVIDSLAALGISMDEEKDIRKTILKLSYMLMRSNVTSILISEIEEKEGGLGRYGVEEFVVDGVVILYYTGIGTQSNRTLHIRKMRATKHSEDIHPLEITSKGIAVKKIEEKYSRV